MRLGQLLGRRRVGVEPGLGEPDAADVDRQDAGHFGGTPLPGGGSGADGELGRPAADVDHEVGAGSVEPGGGAEEREAALLLAGEGLHGRAEDLGRRAEQVVAVGAVAGGAGGGGPNALDAGGVHDVAVLPQHLQGPLRWRRGGAAGWH